MAKVGGALDLVGTALVWFSLVLPWWEAALFGSLTLWEIMSLDQAAYVVVVMAVLALLASGLLGLAGGLVAIILQARTGLTIAGAGGLLAGVLTGLIVLYFYVGVAADSSGLVGLGGGLVIAGLGSLLLVGGGVLVLVEAAIRPSQTPASRWQPPYGGAGGYRPPVG